MSHVKPFVVAVWCGYGKPELNAFLGPFVEEFKEILANGLTINNFHLKVLFHHFSADAPARAYIKGTVIEFKRENVLFRFKNNSQFSLLSAYLQLSGSLIIVSVVLSVCYLEPFFRH